MKLLDRALSAVGLQRRSVTQFTNTFAGAAQNRLMSQWIRRPLSADMELQQGNLVTLRARSRDLARNNAYAKRFVRMTQAHVAGANGVQLLPCNEFANGKPYDAVNEAVEEAWERFTAPRHCSTSGRISFPGLQRLALAEWATSGEALTLVRYGREYAHGIALQPIDCDRLDETFNQSRNRQRGTNEIRYGVEIDEAGKPVAYHILDVHPSELGSSYARAQVRRRIPAETASGLPLVIHLYTHDERVEQTRGVPPLSIAMRDLRHLDGFQEAALVQARIAAASMGFIVTKNPDGDPTTPDEGLEFSAEAGVIRELGMGQEFQAWNPAQPSAAYGEFVKSILRGVAAGLGLSYAMLANDLSEANYSSMRVGRDEEQQYWMGLQGWFIAEFCERVFDAWLPSAILSGALVIPGSDAEKAREHEWIPRRWASIDPVKDIEADERRVALGVTSRQRIAARDGESLWDNMEDLAEEKAYAADLGIDITPVGGVNAGKVEPPDPAANDASGSGSGGAGSASGGRLANPDLALLRSAR